MDGGVWQVRRRGLFHRHAPGDYELYRRPDHDARKAAETRRAAIKARLMAAVDTNRSVSTSSEDEDEVVDESFERRVVADRAGGAAGFPVTGVPTGGVPRARPAESRRRAGVGEGHVEVDVDILRLEELLRRRGFVQEVSAVRGSGGGLEGVYRG
eukprot:1177019-Prorocentrum_minimum.AAC.6